MNLLALSASLLIVFSGPQSVHSERVDQHPDAQSCPRTVGLGPELGRGRPEAVSGASRLSAVLSCRYQVPGAREGTQSHLVGARRVQNPHSVRRLAASLNGLQPYSATDREGSCPPETAEQFYLQFLSRDGGRQSVRLYLSGCRRAIPGTSNRWLHLSSGFEDTLREVVTPKR